MSTKSEMVKTLRNNHFTMQDIKKEMDLSTSYRDELLRVATQLAVGMNAHGCTDSGSLMNINQQALIAAKDLISKVDAEFE